MRDWIFFGVVAVNRRQLAALVPPVLTAIQAQPHCGVATKTATQSATPAVYTSNFTMSVSYSFVLMLKFTSLYPFNVT